MASATSSHDPILHRIPLGCSYFIIWLLRNEELVELPLEDYGHFYKQNCYLLACCTNKATAKGHAGMCVRELSEPGHVDIHFWVGSGAANDQKALVAVELDHFLGGSPVQHRELEGFESRRFISYFPKGVHILNGHAGSAFHRMQAPLQRAALFHVKGKKRPILYELDAIKWSAMTDNDCYILLTLKNIFVWFGTKSNRMERLVSLKIADQLSSMATDVDLPVIEVPDGEEADRLSADELADFGCYLPLNRKESLQTIDVLSNLATKAETFGKLENNFVHLYRCLQQEDGQIEVRYVKDGPLKRMDLDSNDTFILDNRSHGIWVWVGRQAPTRERSVALKYAMDLIETKSYSNLTEVAKVIEGHETVEFKALFQSWLPDDGRERWLNARLFRLLRDGSFTQVQQFDAHDLEEDNVMILDTVDKIYVWLGRDLQAIEGRQVEGLYADYIALLYGQLYLKHDQSGRHFTTEQIRLVKQDDEGEEFKSFFR